MDMERQIRRNFELATALTPEDKERVKRWHEAEDRAAARYAEPAPAPATSDSL